MLGLKCVKCSKNITFNKFINRDIVLLRALKIQRHQSESRQESIIVMSIRLISILRVNCYLEYLYN